MANVDAPQGWIATTKVGDNPSTQGTSKYLISSAYGTGIYAGDPVILHDTNGTILVSTTAADITLGVFNGCRYTDPTTSKPRWSNYYPASTAASDIIAHVYDDPYQQFEVQADATFTTADIGDCVDISYTAGSTVNGRSKAELKSTKATSAQGGKTWQIIRLSEDPNNSDTSAANANWVVAARLHFFKEND